MINWKIHKHSSAKAVALTAALVFTFSGISFGDQGSSRFMPVSKSGSSGNISDLSQTKSKAPDCRKAASLLDVSKIRIPEQFGKITETYCSQSAAPGPQRIIVHVQDLHCNYEAQKKLAGIIEHLYKNYGISLILVEGGYGDVSLSYLRKEGTKERRLEVAEKYLKDGLISGEEYLDIVCDYPIKLWGIEDEALYQENVDAFLAADKIKDDITRYLGAIDGAVKELKPCIYNKALIELDEKALLYREDKLGLSEYAPYLCGAAKRAGLPLSAYPNLAGFARLLELEKSADFKRVEIERAALIEDLARRLSKYKLQELSAKSQAFKDGKVSSAAFYDYLVEATAKANISIDEYPALRSYVDYVKRSDSVDAKKLLSEITALQGQALEGLCRRDDERKLLEIAEGLLLVTDLANLKLSPDDYAVFLARKNSFDVKGWLEFLDEKARRYKISHYVPVYSSIVEDNLDKLNSFYVIAGKRDGAIVGNTLAALERENPDGNQEVTAAVLVTGGFHTEKVSKVLEENKVSYVVISPKVTQTADDDTYRRVLKYKEEHRLSKAE